MDTLFLSKVVASLILPPGGIIVLLATGLALRRWRPRFGMGLIVCALVSLYLLSVGPVARVLLAPLERVAPVGSEALAAFEAEAIVVLGGGRRSHAPEYGGETVSPTTLERIRYGAKLHRETGIPLAVTGGAVFGENQPEAVLMARALSEDFGVPVRWVEPESRNTEENAAFTRRMLERDGMTRVLLVSHAAHLSRAVPMFRAEGLAVLEAPTAFVTGPSEPATWRDWIPSGGALGASWFALHEHLGRLWFRLRQWSGVALSEPGAG